MFKSKANGRKIAVRALVCALLPCASILVTSCKTSDIFADALSQPLSPVLQNGEPERRGPVINEAAFNKGAIGSTLAPYSGYVGTMRVSFSANRGEIESDLNELAKVAPNNFSPNDMVTVDFTNQSMTYILDQLLRGALGVNYVAPDDLPQRVTLRIEEPLPKSRILQVVRDLLSRNNLVMRLFNGVYQIGAPDVIETLQANSTLGRPGDDVTRIIDLGTGNARQVINLAGQLLPQNVSVMASSSSDKVVVRAAESDLESIERLLLSLSRMAVGSDQVAIIPLQRSAPEAVADQLNRFYAATLREDDSRVTVIPLQNQQAILVGASDASTMRGLQLIAEQLDRSVTDASELRVIAVTHRRAADLVPQLVQLFGSTAAPLEVAQADPETVRRSTGVLSRLRLPSSATVDDNADGTGLAVPTPNLSAQSETQGRVGGSQQASGGEGGQQSGGPFNASVASAPQAGETRIVADPSTNSIMVFSTYSVYKRMRDVVQTLDVAQAQVVIEATVLEVQLNDALQTGVQFFLQSHGISVGSGIPAGADTATRGGMIGVSRFIGDVDVQLVMKALREVTNFKVVSSPYLTVIDGQPARLVIGDQIPFATSTQTSSNTAGTTVTQNIEILDTGVVLEITPRIHANNSVDLTIVQSVSTPSASDGTNLTPVVATRDISSQVLAQSGHTILLGGMIQDRLQANEEGVPKLAQVPVIGGLFRQNQTTARRTELLVLITPRVVRSQSEIENINRLLQGALIGQAVNTPPPVYKP